MGIKNTLAVWLIVSSSIVSDGQSLGKQSEKIAKNLTEAFDIDKENHTQIVVSKISDLEKKYGREKTKEIIRKHGLIEINKYRIEQWVASYTTNMVLEQTAQNHADDMSENKYFDHKDLQGKHVWDRVNREWWYDYRSCWENISNDNTLASVVSSYVHSRKGWHEEIFQWKYEDIWIWISPVLAANSTSDPEYLFVFDFGKKIQLPNKTK